MDVSSSSSASLPMDITGISPVVSGIRDRDQKSVSEVMPGLKSMPSVDEPSKLNNPFPLPITQIASASTLQSNMLHGSSTTAHPNSIGGNVMESSHVVTGANLGSILNTSASMMPKTLSDGQPGMVNAVPGGQTYPISATVTQGMPMETLAKDGSNGSVGAMNGGLGTNNQGIPTTTGVIPPGAPNLVMPGVSGSLIHHPPPVKNMPKPKPQKVYVPPAPSGYRDPTKEEMKYTDELVNSKVTIFWDGDAMFYNAIVVGYNSLTKLFSVKYENDNTGPYDENFSTGMWKLWDGTQHSALAERKSLPSRSCRVEQSVEDAKPVKPAKNPSYEIMTVEAVYHRNEKKGTSLQAVRNYIGNNFNVGGMQVASFNKKTMDGLNLAVANGRLIRVKQHSFVVSNDEKNRRINAERQEKAARLAALRRNSLASNRAKTYLRGADRDGWDFAFYGTAVENNANLRKKLVEQKARRDAFLKENIKLLKPFLPENNYFKKLEIREIKKAANLLTTSSSTSVPAVGPNVVAPGTESMLEMTSNLVKVESPDEMEEGFANEREETVEVEDVEEVTVNDILNKALEGVTMLPKPTSITAKLHTHQVQGISWMVHMFDRGMPMILGDQMGLGKTLQSIGFLAYLKEVKRETGPFLVVVPLSVLSNWINEIERFCPKFRTIRFHGPREERDRIKSEELDHLEDFDIVVTTFEMLVSEVNFFKRKYMWTTIIVDEGHRLKNEKSQLSEKLRTIPCLSKVILTGTPLQNNLRELWALLHYLAPDIFTVTTAQKFEDGFDALRNKIDNKLLRLSRKLLGAFMLRRLKEHVAIELPSRKEITVLVPLTDRQIGLYKALLCGLDSNTIDTVMTSSNSSQNLVADAANGNSSSSGSRKKSSNGIKASTSKNSLASTGSATAEQSEWRKLMNLLLQLRKVCNHTYLMPDMAPDPYEINENIVQGSGKLLMLDRMLPRLRQDGHRVLLFSQFTSMLDLLEDYCELRNWSFVRLDGETNRVQRRLDVRRYNAANSNIFIFLISTRAGGLGLNLASADTVILYDSDWNPQVDLQAMERAHRIGQTKPVRVFRLICGGSIEERMINRAEKKLYLNAMVAEGHDEDIDEYGNIIGEEDGASKGEGGDNENDLDGIGKMSKSELASLIRFGANAVFESEENESHISDEALDHLLERQGRDKIAPVPQSSNSEATAATHSSLLPATSSSDSKDTMSNGITVDSTKVRDVEAESQNILKQRLERLKEVDLRQLGNTLYSKSKIDDADVDNRNIVYVQDDQRNSEDLDILTLDTKRVRKERIKMVDGSGSGYGSAIPVLAASMDLEFIPTSSAIKRSRDWEHQNFCCFCGKSHFANRMIKCAHCPKVFHDYCLEDAGVFRGPTMFICPHHKCSSCARSTGAAGGLLFRCTGCMTSYCEDCLPQDEVESMGKHRDYEELGYVSKQAYFIKCGSCCREEGLQVTGVHGDVHLQQAQNTHHHAGPPAALATTTSTGSHAIPTGIIGVNNGLPLQTGVEEVDEEEEPEVYERLDTQYMRVYMQEQVDYEEQSKKRKRKKSTPKGRKK